MQRDDGAMFPRRSSEFPLPACLVNLQHAFEAFAEVHAFSIGQGGEPWAASGFTFSNS